MDPLEKLIAQDRHASLVDRVSYAAGASTGAPTCPNRLYDAVLVVRLRRSNVAV